MQTDVANHRYGPFLETLAIPSQDVYKRFQSFADRLDLVDIEKTESVMTGYLASFKGPRAQAAWKITQAHEDETAEMALSLSQVQGPSELVIAQAILRVSPYHPYARATLVSKSWDAVQNQMPTWEKESGNSPAFLGALGTHYSTAKNYDEAERVLRRYIELSPDLWAYQALAANYKAQGKVDQWLETLEKYLQKEADLGLDHARIRVDIADYYMGLKQWAKAKPYADAAAQTWAQWAMDCAGRCAEGQEDWVQAELWYSRVAERYPDFDWAGWYLFCKRTGRGKLEAAREFAEQYITANANRPEKLLPEYAGCFYWLDGRPKQAKEAFDKGYKVGKSMSAGLCAAIIADDEKDATRRDALLKEIVTKHVGKAPNAATICKLFLESVLDPSGAKPLDVAALDRVIGSLPESARGNNDFFAGRLLVNHGDAKTAKKYLERCVESPETFVWYRFLARDALNHLSDN